MKVQHRGTGADKTPKVDLWLPGLGSDGGGVGSQDIIAEGFRVSFSGDEGL
jgi:hypothetical protein